MEKNSNLYKNFFLFKGLSDDEKTSLLEESTPEIIVFSRGDTAYSKSDNEKKIGYVIDGKCEVCHTRSDGTKVVINILNQGDSFGVLAAFSDNEFPTEIVASKNTKIAFFKKEDIIKFIKSQGEIAMNVIDFMVNRIEFLNEKIITFSGISVEQKLSSYLLSEAKSKGEIFEFNRKKTAEAISAGRASVYRALDSFVEQGIIDFDSKKIYIIDRKGLERISK